MSDGSERDDEASEAEDAISALTCSRRRERSWDNVPSSMTPGVVRDTATLDCGGRGEGLGKGVTIGGGWRDWTLVEVRRIRFWPPDGWRPRREGPFGMLEGERERRERKHHGISTMNSNSLTD